jgi:hypothetical protein
MASKKASIYKSTRKRKRKNGRERTENATSETTTIPLGFQVIGFHKAVVDVS